MAHQTELMSRPRACTSAADRRRRRVLWLAALGCASGLIACHGGAQDTAVVKPSTPRDEFDIRLDPVAAGRPAVNRLILGNNVQWVDRGDNLLDPLGHMRPDMLALVQALHPAILRFPGGSQTDTFHWERPENEHFNARRMQPTIMGTKEFLEFCEMVGSEALFSVNISSGTPDEAARWVALTNRQGVVSRQTGKRLPPVKYWELGNEPYLKDEAHPELWISPEEFGRRAQAFIVAMRAVDPAIVISLPLTNDKRNGYPATPYQGFTRQVLAQVTAPIDAVALHNAYLPYAMEREHSQDALYWGAMAASRTVRADFDAMRSLLREIRPDQHWAFQLTEYNAMFTLGRGESDEWLAAPAAAIYVADLLRELAGMPDVAMANYWSLSGNWRFGAIRGDGSPGPAYAALELVNDALRGVLLAPLVRAQEVSTPSVGGSAPVQQLPLLEVLATRENNTVRLLLIHKDDTRDGHGSVHLENGVAGSAHLKVLQWDDVWALDKHPATALRDADLKTAGADLTVDLPPHSLALLSIEMGK